MTIRALPFVAAVALAAPAPAAASRWISSDLARSPAPPRAAIGPGGTGVVTWADRRGTFAVVSGAHGRFGRPQRLAPESADLPVAAVAPDGSALVAYVDARGLEVRVRRPGHRFGAPLVVTDALGNRRDFVELSAAADPRGGYVLTFTPARRSRRYGVVQTVDAVTLDAAGRAGPIDVLGEGRFALEAEQEQAIAVDGAGLASLVFLHEPSTGPVTLVLAQRPEGGRFAAVPVAGTSDVADPRVTASSAGTAVTWVSDASGGDSGAFGPAGVLASPASTPFTVAARYPRRDFDPSVAPVGSGRALLVFQRKTAPNPFTRTAPLWSAVVGPGGIGTLRRMTSGPADEAVASPLSGDRALVTWREHRTFRAALIDSAGNATPTTAPAGRSTSIFFYVSDVVATGGRYALFAWADADRRLHAAIRRF